MGSARRTVLSAIAALFVGILASPQVHAAGVPPVRSLLEIRREGVVVQGFDLSCASAALATILTYQHGDPVTEREIARAFIRRPEYLANPELVRLRQGFSLLDMKRFVDARGYEGVGLGNLELTDLEDLAPVIVPVQMNGFPHFVVYRGSEGDRVLLADPAFGNQTVRVDRFEAAWIDAPEFGRVGFVVQRRDGLAPPNRLVPRPRDFMM